MESVIVDGGADEDSRAKKRRKRNTPPKMDQWISCDLCNKWHSVSAKVATNFGDGEDGEEGEEWFW